MELIELRPAFCWDCPECGRTRLEECVIKEGPKPNTYCMDHPVRVKCKDCGYQGDTCHFNGGCHEGVE